MRERSRHQYKYNTVTTDLPDQLEYGSGRLLVARVLVWVVEHGQAPVCLADVLGGAAAGQAEHLIEAGWIHGS